MASILCIKRIVYMKYITTFVVSKENDRTKKKRTKKRKRK